MEIKYIFPDDYNPVYANGAYGGTGTQRDLVINFYHERMGLPYSETHDVKPDGRLGKQIARDPATDPLIVVRYVTTGVVMDESAARRLHDWLAQKIAAYDKRKEKA